MTGCPTAIVISRVFFRFVGVHGLLLHQMVCAPPSMRAINRAVANGSPLAPIAPAAVPVTIGDWHAHGRKIAGEIREVEFFAEALPGT